MLSVNFAESDIFDAEIGILWGSRNNLSNRKIYHVAVIYKTISTQFFYNPAVLTHMHNNKYRKADLFDLSQLYFINLRNELSTGICVHVNVRSKK